jgi:WD40 repeat protein/tRNA A-37 threonylcarbamoyl transferase component Bud32
MEPLDSGLHVAGLTEFLASPAPAAADLEPGARLGDVMIVRLVGEGGMGRVYEGLQGMPCRTVAVKMIRPGVLSPAAARRFEHEAQILGRLTHPGIARIYSVGMQPLAGGTVPYFVMEYVEEGKSITEFATARGLGMRDRVALFREACRAVAHGHQKGVIHRDLKPGNILVDAAGHPKVIDFGVARSTDADVARTTMLTDVGQLVGTLQYMSPEQFDGEVDEIDVRADVYALGVVLYELLAGKPPYDIAKRPVYEAARIVHDTEPRSLATVNPKLRGDVATIVAKCLEKERGRRYSSAAELEADLGRYLRGEPITASPPGLVDGLLRLARRHRVAAAAAAASLTALVAAVIGVSMFAVQAERERKAAVAERQRADDASREATRQLYVANLQSLQAALDARNIRLARRLYADNSAIVEHPLPLEMRVLGAGLDDALAVLDLGHGPVSRMCYAPDGGRIAANSRAISEIITPELTPVFRRALVGNSSWGIDVPNEKSFYFDVSATGRHVSRQACDAEWVRLWRAANDDVSGLEEAANGRGVPLAMTADGRRLAVHAVDGRVRIVGTEGGDVGVVLEGHRGRLVRATFTADGRRVFVQISNDVLGLWNAEDGRLIERWNADGRTIDVFLVSANGAKCIVIGSLKDSSRQTARVYATADGRELATITIPKPWANLSKANVAVSPDGTRLVTAAEDNALHVWDLGSGAEAARLRGHAAPVTAVAFSADGTQIASGSVNGAVRLWDARRLVAGRELLAHDGAVTALAFRPGDATLASGSLDGTVRTWSRTLAGLLADITGARGMTAAAFSPDGRWLAIAPQGAGTIELWNPRTVDRLRVLDTAGAIVHQIVFAPDGRRVAAILASSAEDGDVRVWSLADGEAEAVLVGHERGAVGLAFNTDGARLVTTSGDGTVRLWEVSSGRRLLEIPAEIPIMQAKVGAVLGLDGTRIASPTRKLLDAETGANVDQLPSQGNLTAMAVSPGGELFASGVANGTMYVNDFVTGSIVARLVGHAQAVRAAVFSADGTRLATASTDGTARLWDVRAATEIRVFSGHEAPVEEVFLTPDARRIVTASRDGTVRIWDTEGQELCRLPGQPDWPRAIALSPDGTLLVAAAAGGVARIHGLSNADVTRARTESVDEPPAPQALRETPPDRPGPAG